MKREVRKRCGFGCVVCGTPIIEYHHMTPWSEVHIHEPDNLTLLCDLHHKEATGNRPLLTDAQVRRANNNPFNLRKGTTKPHMLHFEGTECIVTMGNNTFHGADDTDFVAAAIDGYPFLGFRLEDGVYLLQFRYHTADNKLALLIHDNELSFAADLWDVQWTANQLIIREKLREIILDIEFHPPNKVSINRGLLHWNGVKIEIKPDFVNNGGRMFLAGSSARAGVGLLAGHDPRHLITAAFYAEDPARLPGFEYAERSACLTCFPAAP